ncbi:hypothetical protein Tco_0063847 [Tanacetum coccineum]
MCPRFILEFYSQYRLSYFEEGQMFIEFVILNQYFSLSLEDFAQILRIPCEGACVFSDRWSLDELVYGAPSEGPNQTNLLSPDDIILYIREDREGQVILMRHQEEVEIVQSIFPELAIDLYISHDRVMHPLAPHYDRKKQSDHGKKRPRESNTSSSSTTLNHPSSSHPLDDPIDKDDDESFHSNSSSLS